MKVDPEGLPVGEHYARYVIVQKREIRSLIQIIYSDIFYSALKLMMYQM